MGEVPHNYPQGSGTRPVVGIKSAAAVTAITGCTNGIVLSSILRRGTPPTPSLPVSPTLPLPLSVDESDTACVLTRFAPGGSGHAPTLPAIEGKPFTSMPPDRRW